jgi:hypothetical protein
MLYIESVDVAKDFSITSLNNYLGLIYEHDGSDYEAGKIYGTHNPISSELGFLYLGGANAHFSIDRMEALPGADVLLRCEAGHGRMVASKGEQFKTVSSSILLGALANGEDFNQKPYLLAEIMHYFIGINEGQWALSLIPEPYEGGTIDGAGYFGAGEEIEVNAVPHQNWEFVNWTTNLGEVVSFEPLLSYTMPDANSRLHANFRLVTSQPEFGALIEPWVYPNPTKLNSTVIVPSALAGNYFTVHDLAGRIVITGRLQPSKTVLETADLPPGTYIFRLTGQQSKPVRLVRY